MQTDGQRLPGVSYVMPVLNEVTEVRAAVASLLDQDYAGPFEVVLALGPSIDGTNELVAEMSAADPRIRAVDNPVGSTPAGLNVAIRASSTLSWSGWTRTRCCRRTTRASPSGP